MPYIVQARRVVIDNYILAIDSPPLGELQLQADATPQDCGELNYAFTMVCLNSKSLKLSSLDWTIRKIAFDYLSGKPLRYQRINDVAGALACAALELEDRCPGTKKFEAMTLTHAMRRPYTEIAAAYERTKIAENGDIEGYKVPR